jgi:hypothetical protein
MQLTAAQLALLRAIRDGATLKVHRDLDGAKIHLLHPLAGEPLSIAPDLVDSLQRLGLIQSNLKFPAATYILTDRALAALDRDAPG